MALDRLVGGGLDEDTPDLELLAALKDELGVRLVAAEARPAQAARALATPARTALDAVQPPPDEAGCVAALTDRRAAVLALPGLARRIGCPWRRTDAS